MLCCGRQLPTIGSASDQHAGILAAMPMLKCSAQVGKSESRFALDWDLSVQPLQLFTPDATAPRLAQLSRTAVRIALGPGGDVAMADVGASVEPPPRGRGAQ